jgi:hypothetical protein
VFEQGPLAWLDGSEYPTTLITTPHLRQQYVRAGDAMVRAPSEKQFAALFLVQCHEVQELGDVVRRSYPKYQFLLNGNKGCTLKLRLGGKAKFLGRQ